MPEVLTKEIFQKIRQVEIKTRGLVNNIFGGEYHSAFKGKGMTFSEVREYQYGDDVRAIDWNVSARRGDTYIKVFEEEREQTLMLLFDASASFDFGSRDQLKRELSALLCATLAFSAIKNNDKVGLLIFTDEIEKFITPRKGRVHVLRILREIFFFKPKNKRTSIKKACEFTRRVLKRRSIVFLISDLLCNTAYENEMRLLKQKHDFVVIHVNDKQEQNLPLNLGYVELEDLESGSYLTLNTFNKKLIKSFSQKLTAQLEHKKNQLSRKSIDVITIQTAESFIEPLTLFFRKRK